MLKYPLPPLTWSPAYVEHMLSLIITLSHLYVSKNCRLLKLLSVIFFAGGGGGGGGGGGVFVRLGSRSTCQVADVTVELKVLTMSKNPIREIQLTQIYSRYLIRAASSYSNISTYLD